MLRRRSTSTTKLLRTCWECGSEAVSSMGADDVDESTLRVNVRCGECRTWRAVTLHRAEEHAVVTRMERIQRGQRRGIERDLRLLTAAHAAGYQPETQLRAAK